MPAETMSAWQTADLTRTYLEGVRGASPGAELQLAVIGKIIDQWCPSASRVLDLGCGDGILGKFALSRLRAASGLFVDFSEPMLAAARANVGMLPNVTVARADFSNSQWMQVAASPFDLVVSGFAIHHQPDARKRELYGEIFSLLKPNGVFLNMEHVASASEAGEAMFDDFFIDHLHAFHCRSNASTDREEIADNYYGRPDRDENILAPVGEQCDWLREIGFLDADCFLKIFELALFGGRKPPVNSRG